MKISTVYTNADNTYEYELKPADTQSLAPGQYFVLVQHPMMNGVFDIYYDGSTGSVINRQLRIWYFNLSAYWHGKPPKT